MEIKIFPVNPLEENCYVVSGATSEAILIDCGAMLPKEWLGIASYIETECLRPVAHLLTHAHFDHIFGCQAVYDAYALMPRFHAADAELYHRVTEQVSNLMHRDINVALPPEGMPVGNGETLRTAGMEVRVIHTPGHTPGGVCYYFPEEGVLFSGDSLFSCSIGRTDLPGGNTKDLLRALRERILTLPPDTRVYPGHGPSTLIEIERDCNPYLHNNTWK